MVNISFFHIAWSFKLLKQFDQQLPNLLNGGFGGVSKSINKKAIIFVNF